MLLPYSGDRWKKWFETLFKIWSWAHVSNFIQNSVANFIAPSFHERSIKERTFTCPVCWALLGSPLSLPQLHFTVWPLMSVLCTATIACVADSLVENLKYNQTDESQISSLYFVRLPLHLMILWFSEFEKRQLFQHLCTSLFIFNLFAMRQNENDHFVEGKGDRTREHSFFEFWMISSFGNNLYTGFCWPLYVSYNILSCRSYSFLHW